MSSVSVGIQIIPYIVESFRVSEILEMVYRLDSIVFESQSYNENRMKITSCSIWEKKSRVNILGTGIWKNSNIVQAIRP